jgi:hypothetical protein
MADYLLAIGFGWKLYIFRPNSHNLQNTYSLFNKRLSTFSTPATTNDFYKFAYVSNVLPHLRNTSLVLFSIAFWTIGPGCAIRASNKKLPIVLVSMKTICGRALSPFV